MRRHATAVPAGSIATARSAGWRLGVLALLASALLLLPAERAFGIANVSVVKDGPGAATGTVVSDPPGIDCGSSCGPVQYFSDVKLTASAGPGFVFWNWSGATCANGQRSNPCQLAPDFANDRTVTATFIVPPDPPIAATGDRAELNSYLSSLAGTVNPNDFEVDSCVFEYGPTTAYGTSVPCTPSASALGAGNAPVAVGAETEPLEPNTTYHYRLTAANLGGSGSGEDRTFTTGPAGPDSCSNADRRAEQGIAAILLPGCMALEMASPPQKAGQPAKEPIISASGDRVAFRSGAPLGGTPGVLSPVGDFYVASRGPSGWSTVPTVPPAQTPKGQNTFPVALSFSPDLSSWFQVAATPTEYEAGRGQVYRGDVSGPFEPLSAPLIPFDDTSVSELPIKELTLEASSADHSHFYFKPGDWGNNGNATRYFADDPVLAGASIDRNVYVANRDATGSPSLALLARDSVGKVWGGRCGVRIGGNKTANGTVTHNQGAVSADGSRVYFSTRPAQAAEAFCQQANRLRILVRNESPSGVVQIEPLFSSECTRVAPPCSTQDGDDRFQAASVDGSRVYFTTVRQLANSDTDATADLYLYDGSLPVGEKLVQVSAGDSTDATPGSGADVQGNAVAISTDGSHVYFVATDVLTTDPNPTSAAAAPGGLNLYLYRRDAAHPAGDTAFVGALAVADGGAADSNSLWGDLSGYINGAFPVPASGQDEAGKEIGGDGHILLLKTRASLTAADADGGRLDAFRFDATAGTLECVSCKPGGPDAEPFDINGALGTGVPLQPGTDRERLRWVSEDGESVLFFSSEAFLPGDPGGGGDYFLWRQGQLSRLPGSPFLVTNVGARAVISRDGSAIAFQSRTALLPQDGDTASDVYVARVGGGFPLPVAEEPCQIDEAIPGRRCQQTAPSPVPPVHASGAPTAGNVAQPPRCRKGFVRKHGRCVKKKKPGKHGRAHGKKKKNASNDRQANGNRRTAK